ncbi:MAG: hypothetical protein JW720_14250 [Sedimentisphaerales bacterium]|nr:hypothetical protein [Sedimentisphaerales bacterium]
MLAVTIPYTAITIIFIVLATGLGAFIRRRSRDKCLRDFEANMATLEDKAGKVVWGRLRVESTGLEFIYHEKQQDTQGHYEASYILYKHEFPNIGAVIRYLDDLSEPNKKKRQRALKAIYHPGLCRRFKRKLLNVFKTVRDSVAEIVNLLMSQAKKATPAGRVLTSQDKYVSQMKDELMGSVGTSYEPLLERYIGRKVVLELIKGEEIHEHCGVLKNYTAEFIEIMDVDYKPNEDKPARKADMIVPRKHAVVRHLAE